MEGILLIDKPKGKTSFHLVALLRKLTNVQKIGHGGTLDPLATGVMVLLVGKAFTTKADSFLTHDKEYTTRILLGTETDSYDITGAITRQETTIPTLEEITKALTLFQGTVSQIPPMFSAKKHKGKKLYELARKGQEIERKPSIVTIKTTLLSYEYPYLDLHISASKGTYIRTIAFDLGRALGCGATVFELRRTRQGPFSIKECITTQELVDYFAQTTSKSLPLKGYATFQETSHA
ncbi:MAG: tRNA pseudouridine(55) synthase TruB [Verrucomicrobia bacterium]|nr:tRNA pseudouridine(55) synthase TruB [Verrucomicrobiota bacterium]